MCDGTGIVCGYKCTQPCPDCRPPPAQPFFEESNDLNEICIILQDDKFFMAAYVLCGRRERWYACLDQLKTLFVEFIDAELPDHKLFRLAALMWQWTSRLGSLTEIDAAKCYFLTELDFILGDRLNAQLQGLMRQASDGVWEWRAKW